MKNQQPIPSIGSTYESIKQVIEKARGTAYRAVNFIMVAAYWNIGKIIVEKEQKGKKRADYGAYLLQELSARLTKEYGQGFDESNLRYIRLFYLTFQKCDALRHELSWTHYRTLLHIKNKQARDFYTIECINSRWNTRELERQINTLLYERLAISRDKKRVMELSVKGQAIQKPEDIIKDPYVLEFLNLKENRAFHEKDIEKALIEKSKELLLELGRGFSFVERQSRITVDGEHYYVDLVFYNYILKCFVLIDLKVGKLTHQDIGQMDFYVRYFEKEKRQKEDNPTIGLILCSGKNEAMAKYTLLEKNKRIFASKYRLCLPDEETLKKEISYERKKIEEQIKETQ
ncbi:MAG: PDDEXK nuclease domain-containing protein [Candidatus Woesearchaeota archaeon]